MGVEFGISMLTERLRPEAAPARNSLLPDGHSQVTNEAGPSFKETLQTALGEVNEAMKAADSATQKFASGQATSLHEVMIAMEKADLSLRTLSAVRNKVVDAYQEVMRMQV